MSTSEHKPLGRQAYTSIPHLPGSRLGSGEHCISKGQERIATYETRDAHDCVIVQEKLDGCCCAVARINDEIIALSRKGRIAATSELKLHQMFATWVKKNEDRFRALLKDGERVCGEWLVQAHGTRYILPHEPFVAFDIMKEQSRVPFLEFYERTVDTFVIPRTLSVGDSLSIEAALLMLEISGHGAVDPVEGAIWRVERKGKLDFICKYVRHDKLDGCYLEFVSGKEAVWNTYPEI
jgi:hypothetical protein